ASLFQRLPPNFARGSQDDLEDSNPHTHPLCGGVCSVKKSAKYKNGRGILTMNKPFSADFALRPALMEDAAALTNLIALRDRLDYPPNLDYRPEYTIEDIQAEWQSLDLAANTRLVLAPGDQLVGYLGITTGFVDAARTQQYIGIHSFS